MSSTGLTHSYGTFCDDFYVNMRLGTQLTLATERSSALHFLEQMRKGFPRLVHLRGGPAGGLVASAPAPAPPPIELHLEEPRQERHSYRWVSVEARRLACGHVNPSSLEEAARVHRLALEIAPYALGLSPLEIEFLDVLFGFDLEFNGNHEQVVADSLLAGSPLTCLQEEPDAHPADVAPAITFSLNPAGTLQARLEVLPRTAGFGNEAGGDSGVLSIYFILRRYWPLEGEESPQTVHAALLRQADDLLARQVVPRVLRPISDAIASRS